MSRLDPRLFAVIDPGEARCGDLGRLAGTALAGGCTAILYGGASGGARALVEDARRLAAARHGSGVPLLVRSRVDVALAAGADGVHLGPDDLDPVDVRRLLGPAAIIGVGVDAADETGDLGAMPIDYALLGGSDPRRPARLATLARIAARLRRDAPGLLLVAFVGTDPGAVPPMIGAGADGIAAGPPWSGRDDVTGSARRLRATVDAALAARGA